MYNHHNSIFKLLTCIIFCVLWGLSASAKSKPLSEKDRLQLTVIARNHYNMTEMDGASVYRFKGREILLVIVDVKKTPNAQRVGQVKAARTAGEFLQSATNESVTVYEVSEDDSYAFKDKSVEYGSTSGTTVSDRMEQGTSDITATATQETLSDKIVQSSITRVGHIEPLCRVSAEGNHIVLAYYLVMEK